MKNFNIIKSPNIFINKVNIIQLTALTVFIIYLCSITLAPIGSIAAGIGKNKFYFSALKFGSNTVAEITIATYIINGQMLARQIDNNNLQSYINDAKGAVLKLNNSNNSISQNYSYDAYGNIINAAWEDPAAAQKTSAIANPAITQSIDAQRSNPSSLIPNLFMYNGERFDRNTNLQYLRARFYNPETKRFLNQDTYDLLNRFGYVNENPVMGIDPSGCNAVDDWIAGAWNSATNWVSSIFHTDNSTASHAVLGAIIAIAGTIIVSGGIYGSYRLRNKYRSRQIIASEQSTSIIITRAAEEAEEQKCEICFEKPGIKNLVFSCMHVSSYCSKCIEDWITQNEKSGTAAECPGCRKPLKIPSSTAPATAGTLLIAALPAPVPISVIMRDGAVYSMILPTPGPGNEREANTNVAISANSVHQRSLVWDFRNSNHANLTKILESAYLSPADILDYGNRIRITRL